MYLPTVFIFYTASKWISFKYKLQSKKKESMSRAVLNSLQRISVAIDVARGIEHLHRIKPNPIVHRDIKP